MIDAIALLILLRYGVDWRKSQRKKRRRCKLLLLHRFPKYTSALRVRETPACDLTVVSTTFVSLLLYTLKAWILHCDRKADAVDNGPS